MWIDTFVNAFPKQQQQQASIPSVPLLCASPFLMDLSWQPVTGAAQRRKQRRLRSWWRHEQQSIAAALATSQHHSALRGQKKARAREEESETKYTAKVRKTPPPQPVIFSLFEEEPGGTRPASLAEPPRPQERVQRHTMEHIVDFVRVAPMVQILDALVPQTVEQLPDVLQFFDRLSTVPEQVLEVPEILPEDVSLRKAVREPRLVEQLVEVPTIVSFSSLQRTVELNVDVPVVGGSGAGGVSGFLPGQHFSMTAEQIVDNPVPRPGGAGDLQGLPRGQSSTAFSEHIAEFPDPGGGPHDFQPVQDSAASSSVSPGHAGESFFRTFPNRKKSSKIPRTQGSELGAESSLWTS